jgi:hypothetical protein
MAQPVCADRLPRRTSGAPGLAALVPDDERAAWVAWSAPGPASARARSSPAPADGEVAWVRSKSSPTDGGSAIRGVSIDVTRRSPRSRPSSPPSAGWRAASPTSATTG